MLHPSIHLSSVSLQLSALYSAVHHHCHWHFRVATMAEQRKTRWRGALICIAFDLFVPQRFMWLAEFWQNATYPSAIIPTTYPFRVCESIWQCSTPPPDASRPRERWDPETPADAAAATRSIYTPQMRCSRLGLHQIWGVENRPCPNWATDWMRAWSW